MMARSSLQDGFYNLICFKILRYHCNHGRNLPVAVKDTEPLDSECLPNSEASENSDFGNSDINCDEESDYSETQSKRSRSLKSTPRSTDRKTMLPYGAPVAPMMGNAQATLAPHRRETGQATRRFTQSSQHKRQSVTSSGSRNEQQRTRVESLPIKSTPMSASPGPKPHITLGSPVSKVPSPSRDSNDLPERHKKRSSGHDAHGATSKRSKLPDKVGPRRPSLIVVLKLKREKVAPIPDRTFVAEQATKQIPFASPSGTSSLHSGTANGPGQHAMGGDVHFGQPETRPPAPEVSAPAGPPTLKRQEAHQEHTPTSASRVASVIDVPEDRDCHTMSEHPPQPSALQDDVPASLQKAADSTLNAMGNVNIPAGMHTQELHPEFQAAVRLSGLNSKSLRSIEVPQEVASFKRAFPKYTNLSEEQTKQLIEHLTRNLSIARQRAEAEETSSPACRIPTRNDSTTGGAAPVPEQRAHASTNTGEPTIVLHVGVPLTLAPSSTAATSMETRVAEEHALAVGPKPAESAFLTIPSPNAVTESDMNRAATPSGEPQASTATATTNNTATPTQPQEDVTIAHLVKDIMMFVYLKLEGRSEPKYQGRFRLWTLLSGGHFWSTLQDELGEDDDLVDLGEEIVRAKIMRIEGAAVSGVETDFTMRKASRINESWEEMLAGLRRHYEEHGTTVEWKLKVVVFSKRIADAKVIDAHTQV